MSDLTQNSAEKFVRFVRYLRALSKMSAKTVRSLEQYRQVFWLPLDSGVVRAEQDQTDDALWIEVKRTEKPPLPLPPERCRTWVDSEALENLDVIPELRLPAEFLHRVSAAGKSGGEEALYPDTFARKEQQWQDYIEQQWKPWREQCRQVLFHEKISTDLFRLYQEQQKLGEQYELLLCFGLLTWETPSEEIVQRHLIVVEATISFDPTAKKLCVYQTSQNPRVELDMLSLDEQPADAQRIIQECNQALEGNLRKKQALDAVLDTLGQALSGDSPTSQAGLPSITYAPALIMRKRSMRPLEHILEKILDLCISSSSIPEEFLHLCEILPEEIFENSRGGILEEPEHGAQESSEERLFFPLPSNQEQRRIAEKLKEKKGVLVQGPPGTGKSHTIANLICHLLAQGKRVLVTAQTARALQVLHDLLPEHIRPLCFNAAEQGKKEQEDLERRVKNILAEEKVGQVAGDEKIQELEQRILLKQQARQETEQKILELREQETRQHRICEGRYVGTAAQIAAQLREEEPDLSWFTDSISQENPFPWSTQQLLFLRRYLRTSDEQEEKKLAGKDLPQLEKNFPVHKVQEAFEKEEQAREAADQGKQRIQSGPGKILFQVGKADRKVLESFRDQLADFTETVRELRRRPMSWLKLAVSDVLSGRSGVWENLLQISQKTLQGLPKRIEQVDTLEVDISWEIDRKKLLQDAMTLKKHFKEGGRAGKWIFKPEIVRKHGALLSKIRVDGQPCNTVDALWKLVDYLLVDRKLYYVWHLWEDRAERCTGHFSLQFAELEELLKTLQQVLALHARRKSLEERMALFSGLDMPDWSDPVAVQNLLEDCQAVFARLDFLWLGSSISHAQKSLAVFAQRSNAHPITKLIIKSLQKRDIATYQQLFGEVEELKIRQDELAEKNRLLDELADSAPQLTAQLRSCQQRIEWADRLGQMEQAWAWTQAKDWLATFLASDLESHHRHSQRLAQEIREELSALTAVRAWKHFFQGLGHQQHMHMIAWQQAMKKFGKGTGKHAQAHKENARRHLTACRAALPVWIMPLHRVYETVPAEPGFFDVVIIDEASQCGPEALPLLYLGKQILAAGDDKQISPEAVGVNREHVQQHMQTYLFDFSHADSFDVDSSLFDHGLLRFSNRVVLQEHFRCMPEIIAFSNTHFYQDDPLIPLRQSLPNRLTPLRDVFVKDGTREGQGQRIVNQQEAEALVATVVQCCQDKRYQGKTMGVIVLQGTAQAYLIEELLIRALGVEEMGRRKLICGNSSSFQGRERDVIFLSMVVAPEQKIRALTKTAEQQKFNVAASRACEQMWLFHSVQERHLRPECLRSKLLKHFHQSVQQRVNIEPGELEEIYAVAQGTNRVVEQPPAPFQTWLEVDLAQHLSGMGYRVVPQYPFAGRNIDLVIQGPQAQLALICDGDQWQGPEQYAIDLEHQEKLERCGWQVFRMRASRYSADPEKALDPLVQLLEQLEIMPGF
ncbi:MAG: AAA domain-containing protein [Candidatus Electrothrix aestuarii]|uniref:AAA domain-containing protein n=1 Tax=Candidatus Electrothrix aestuarii TaxID=3062594 RepID=A0AAU8LYC0_9BACT|nr:AAA domain-containing protein [Candidatus Electrothrix aestuarii]